MQEVWEKKKYEVFEAKINNRFCYTSEQNTREEFISLAKESVEKVEVYQS